MVCEPVGEHISLRQADGSSMLDAIIVPSVEITVGLYHTSITIYVTKLGNDMLLGMDFLLAAEAVLNLSDNTLSVCNSTVPIVLNDNSQSNIALVSKTVYIPAGSVHNVVVDHTGPPARAQLLEATCSWKALSVPNVLIDTLQSNPCVTVINLTNRGVKLKRGSVLGTLTNVYPEQVSTRINICSINRKSDILPEYLSDLFSRSSEGLSSSEIRELKCLLIEYQDIFSSHDLDIGCYSNVQHCIKTGDVTPIRQRMRRTPMNFQEEEEKHLTKLLDTGVIEPSSSEWASPPVLVRKKDGSVRYTIDYRSLNKVTQRDAFPLPLIEDCLDSLDGVVYLSGLDMASGYYQVALTEEDRPKTAFITRYGLYQHTRMAMGLCNAPATFQRVMTEVLKDLSWKQVLAYLDDVVVLGSSFKSQLVNLKCVFDRFRTSNLKLKPRKCELFRRKLKFLGWIVSSEGISIPPENIEAVSKRPYPKDVTSLQSFLGYMNYHRAYIPQFAELAAPLYTLTTIDPKKIPYIWKPEHQEAYDALITAMTHAPMLCIPTRSGLFILDTDASNVAIAAELSQIQDGAEHVISYGSHILEKTQRKYCTTRKELLAIVRFSREYRHYLLGRQFVVRTDHHSLTWLLRFKHADGQLSRWLEELSQYDMIIQHRPGKLHVNADWLSRPPEGCEGYLAGTDVHQLPCGGCKFCRRVTEKWAKFKEDVDDVLPSAVVDPSRLFQAAVNQLKAVDIPQDVAPNWYPTYSMDDICKWQQDDPDLTQIWFWIHDDIEPSEGDIAISSSITKFYWLNRNLIQMDNSILYYEWITEHNSKLLLVVPHSLQEELMQESHDKITAGHLGAHKMLIRLREHFFWRGMGKACQLYVETCHTCTKQKKLQTKLKAALCNYHAGNPMDRVHIDILGPFPVSDNGNRYILMLVDQFTKWLEAYPLPDQTAVTVARAVVDNFISRFGCPLVIHTDQGRNFESDLFKAVCTLLEISKTRTTPTHPCSNGQVERYNRTLLGLIRCHVADGKHNWDESVPLMAGAIRSMQNRHTGQTANMMMLGREVRRPLSVVLDDSMSAEHSKSEYIRKLLQNFRDVHNNARQHLKTSLKIQKTAYDKRLKIAKFQPGDLVYRSNLLLKKGQCRKLESPWTGPFLVMEQLSDVTYKVRGRKRNFVLHHDNLRPCRDRVVPIWMKRLRHKLLFMTEDTLPQLTEFWDLVDPVQPGPKPTDVQPSLHLEDTGSSQNRSSCRVHRIPAKYAEYSMY